VIEVHVSNLRRKLDAVLPEAAREDGETPGSIPNSIIETMRGRGYRLAPSAPMPLSMDADDDLAAEPAS
jgi:DNA-binding response OmpR family regulator